jgi:hypothetical protein
MAGRWLANLLLILILVPLGLAIRDDLAREGRPQTLAGIDPADLSLIQVQREGEPTIRIERDPQGWRIREPMVADADPRHIEQLLAILKTPVIRSFPAHSAALAELGLAPPKLTLRLDSLQLGFGGIDPIGERRYVAADSLVHLIDDRFQHLLIAPPIDWLSKSLVPAGESPAFATIDGVPLSPIGLQSLGALVAERLEPLAGELTGGAALLKYRDGRALRFLVSDDRRRWSRLDLKLRYVLAEAPRLPQDPTLVDPTPPEPPPPQPEPAGPPSLPTPGATAEGEVEPPGTFLDSDAPPLERLTPPPPPDPADPFAPMEGADQGVDEEGERFEPKAVRLRADGDRGQDPFAPETVEEGYEDATGGPEPEPARESPQHRGQDPARTQTPKKKIRGMAQPEGMGSDPFAPDPR